MFFKAIFAKIIKIRCNRIKDSAATDSDVSLYLLPISVAQEKIETIIKNIKW